MGPGRRGCLTSLEVDDLAATLAADLQRVDDRRARGVFFTPPDVAARLTALAVASTDHGTATTVVDPACGAGVFLLAAGRCMVDRGVADPATVARRHLFGADIDPASVEACRQLLASWADIEPSEVAGVVVGDPLRAGSAIWPDGPAAGFEAVVGNPPFLGQLRAATTVSAADREALRSRYPGLVAAYTDMAWLFLVAGLDLLADDGQMVLVQPQSVLAARDAGPVRDLLVTEASLIGLWWDQSGVFAGHVEVCAPVVRRTPSGRRGPVQVLVDREVVRSGTALPPEVGETWGTVVAEVLGIPQVPTPDHGPAAGRVGDLAGVTAGFRQHFYGLVAGVAERTGPDDSRPPMVTTALVDPLCLRWAQQPCRFNGRRWRAPVVDLAAVATAQHEVGQWFADRQRPKLLVASQTSVVEVVADPVGSLVPVTPLVVVEPNDPDDLETLWRLAAALSAPSITALAMRRSLGAARSSARLRLSASQVADLPLPSDAATWTQGAALAYDLHTSSDSSTDAGAWRAFGRIMAAAYGVVAGDEVDALIDWWWSRHPARL